MPWGKLEVWLDEISDQMSSAGGLRNTDLLYCVKLNKTYGFFSGFQKQSHLKPGHICFAWESL